MNQDDVTAEHARRISVWLIPMLRLLNRLRERMSARGFPSDDPLFEAVVRSAEAVRQLRAKLHTIEVYRAEDRPNWLKRPNSP